LCGAVGKPQSPGDGEGDDEEGRDLMILDPIGYRIYDVFPFLT
jgi:hypothetical protein